MICKEKANNQTTNSIYENEANETTILNPTAN